MKGARKKRIGTRADVVRRQLEKEILSGKYPPGEHLDEVTHATRLGYSRTPLREAFNQLVAVGLLERQPHCGVFVAKDTVERARELIEAFAEIEALCAGLAAQRMGVRLRAGLLRKAERNPALLRRAIRRGCDNRALAEQAEVLERRVATYRRLEGAAAAERDRAAAHQVAKAVADGEAEAARRAVRDRLHALAETTIRALADGVAAAA
jgi:DNA-binding GntR family transcriptional regulator